MERVSDEWIEEAIDFLIAVYDGKDEETFEAKIILALRELQERRKADGKVLPIPCTKGYEKWMLKDYLQKINEELDELKDAALQGMGCLTCDCKQDELTISVEEAERIADEAADTITAITSMLEAMGIDERQRQAAQERVNEQNKRRGRI